MQTEFFIKYNGLPEYDNSNIDLGDLGKSLVAFDSLIKDLSHIFRVQTEIEIYATSHREGSHIVDLVFRVHESFKSLPIDSPEHLIEFLKIASDQLAGEAIEFFNDIKDLHKTVNDYGSKYPVNITLFALLIPWIFQIVRKQRKNALPADQKISERIARELFKIIHKNKFGEFIKPIINESSKAIELSPDRNFERAVTKIDESNFEDYLGKDTEILPELKDGNNYKLSGEITSLKSTRGDSLTFHYINKEKGYNLDLFPPTGKTTKEYTPYYKENVEVDVTVERYSFFKKPKLHLIDISFKQHQLDFSRNKPTIDQAVEA
jgi:hypothetical protein